MSISNISLPVTSLDLFETEINATLEYEDLSKVAEGVRILEQNYPGTVDTRFAAMNHIAHIIVLTMISKLLVRMYKECKFDNLDKELEVLKRYSDMFEVVYIQDKAMWN